MNDLLPQFAVLWTDSFAGEASQHPPRDAIRLDDLPALPLARTVKMPDGHPYESGALSLQLADLVLEGASRLDRARCALARDGGRVRLALALAPLTLAGRYAVMAKPDPVVPIDTAGNLMDLSPEQLAPIAAGQAAGDPPLDPEKEQWLDNAREQRVKLAQTPNGQVLLGTYSDHNATYEQVMREPSVATNWQADGATKDMARDTHVAVQGDLVVNSPTKAYAGGVTYNGNALAQQMNVALGCLLSDPTFDINGTAPPAPDSKYWAAAKAALSFRKNVESSTGNTKDNVNAMSASQVYGTVDSHSGDVAHVGDDEALQVLTSGAAPGGRDYRPQPGWIVLDEEERARLVRFTTEFLRHQAANAAITGTALFEGTCGAQLTDVTIAVEWLEREPNADGGPARAIAVDVDLPAFDFEIDDSRWSSDAGAIARQRLNRIHFVRTLLHETVVRGLQQAALAAAEQTLARIAGRPA